MHLKSYGNCVIMLILILLCHTLHSLPVLNPSQIDSLIDPIHQSDFEDLESRKVVVKSVFNTPVFTPAPPMRCPHGQQRLANGQCVQKYVVSGFDYDPKLLASLTKEFYRKNPVRHGHRTTQRQDLVPTTTEMTSTVDYTSTSLQPQPPQPQLMQSAYIEAQTRFKDEQDEVTTTMTFHGTPEPQVEHQHQQEQEQQIPDTTTETIEATTIKNTPTSEEMTTISQKSLPLSTDDNFTTRPVDSLESFTQESSWPIPIPINSASLSAVPTIEFPLIKNNSSFNDEFNVSTTIAPTEMETVTLSPDLIIFMSTTPMTIKLEEEEESTEVHLDLEMSDAESGAETMTIQTTQIPIQVELTTTNYSQSQDKNDKLTNFTNSLFIPKSSESPSSTVMVPLLNQLKVQSSLINNSWSTTPQVTTITATETAKSNDLFPFPVNFTTVPTISFDKIDTLNKTQIQFNQTEKSRPEETENAITSVYLELEERTILSPVDGTGTIDHEDEDEQSLSPLKKEFTTAVYLTRQTLEGDVPKSKNDDHVQVKRIQFSMPFREETLDLKYVPSSSDIYKPTMPPYPYPYPRETHRIQPVNANANANVNLMPPTHHQPHHRGSRTFFSFGYLQNYE